MKSTFNMVWLLSYISIASVSAAIITPALPEIQSHYHLSLGGVEWIVSIFLVGYVVGQLIYGPLANRYGRLKALRIGLVVNIIGVGICLVAIALDAFWLLNTGRLITALGAASGLACTFMLINEWLPESLRSTAMAYTVLSFALGAGLAVLIGGITTEYWCWQGCFVILLIQGVIMLVGTCVFSETLVVPKPIQVMTIVKDYTMALSSSKLVVYSLVVGSSASLSYCFSAAGPQIAQNILSLCAAQYGYWNGINIIGMLIGGLFAKQLLTRFRVEKVLALGFLGFAFGIANLVAIWEVSSESALWFFLTTSLLYLFTSLLFSGGALVASNALEDRASAAAMMSFVNMCFATLNVILMGYLANDSLVGFILSLSIMWVLVVGLLLIRQFTRY